MEDAAIIALYWQRDQAAIAASDKKYGALCHSLSFNILHVREDAEECVNDTWHRAWITMPPQRPNSLRAYLCRIVRNLSIDRWRTRYSLRHGQGLGDLVLELEECVPTSPSAEAEWELQEVAGAVDRFLSAQPPLDRWVFLQRYFYGRPLKELAAQAGYSPNGLSQRLRRLRLALRRVLEQEGVRL